MKNKILIVDDQPPIAELTEQFGVEDGVKPARHNPMMMQILLAGALLGGDRIPDISFNDESPNIKTYGSKAVKSFSPDEWKKQKREQARNEPCNCGSGKKYKHCCALSV